MMKHSHLSEKDINKLIEGDVVEGNAQGHKRRREEEPVMMPDMKRLAVAPISSHQRLKKADMTIREVEDLLKHLRMPCVSCGGQSQALIGQEHYKKMRHPVIDSGPWRRGSAPPHQHVARLSGCGAYCFRCLEKLAPVCNQSGCENPVFIMKPTNVFAFHLFCYDHNNRLSRK